MFHEGVAILVYLEYVDDVPWVYVEEVCDVSYIGCLSGHCRWYEPEVEVEYDDEHGWCEEWASHYLSGR